MGNITSPPALSEYEFLVQKSCGNQVFGPETNYNLEPWPGLCSGQLMRRLADAARPVRPINLFDHIVALARQQHVTRGRKLRLDSTVVATTIHFPVDSTLLADGVHVLNSGDQRAKPILQATVERTRPLFRNRSRSVRRMTKQLIDTARRRGEQAAHDLRKIAEHRAATATR